MLFNLICFKQYVVAKARGLTFKKPMLNANVLEDALTDIIKYVQSVLRGRCTNTKARLCRCF